MEDIIYIKPHEDSGEFTTYSFYNYLLPKIREHYRSNRNAPIFSIEKVQRINPLVLPNLIGLGFYLRTFHKHPIQLLMTYEPHLLYYLTKTNFFKICGKKTLINPLGLDIFDFNEGFLGGFSSYIIKEQRKEHQIYYYLPSTDRTDDLYSHDTLIENLSLFTLREQYEEVLRDTVAEDYVYQSIESVSEPISNGILHSESITWAISQTTPGEYSKTTLSIVDVGIGFEESLKKKGITPTIVNKAKKMGLYISSLNDFFYIMEAIYFSMVKNRKGLIDFIFNVASNGIVRIHYQSTQIIFTPRIILNSTGLYDCRQDVTKELDVNGNISELTEKKVLEKMFDLINVLLELRTNDKKYSPVRIFDVIFRGVHIEFEI